MRRIALCLLLAVTVAGGWSAGAAERWIHIRVSGDGPDGEHVSVNIPLRVAESMLPAIETEGLESGKVRLGDAEGFDLRGLLEALRDTPDSDLVTVREDGESVRVFKERGFLVVHADDEGERVRIRLPLKVAEAMVAGGGDELDLAAGLRALADYDGRDLITVESPDSHLRVWLDSSEDGGDGD